MLEQIKETAAWIKAHTQMRPHTAIILARGWDTLPKKSR